MNENKRADPKWEKLFNTPVNAINQFLALSNKNTPISNTRNLDLIREKGRDLTQSYDKSPYTNRNVKRAK